MKGLVSKSMPLALTALGAVIFGTIAVEKTLDYGLSIGGGLFLLSTMVYVLWMLWESRVSVRELKKDEVNQDKHTMELAAVSKMTLLLAAFLLSPRPSLEHAIPGIGIMLLGIVLRTRAISQLGSRYSHRIRRPVLPLEERGVYNYIRHPAYLGTWVIHLGLVLVFLNTWSIMALLLLWLPAVVIRTIVEERYLANLPEYLQYKARVRSRLIPYVW